LGTKALVEQEVVDRLRHPTDGDKYYSAEFWINGLGTPYQFKIRNDLSRPLSVLVREDSKIVPWLRVGDIVTVRYHSVKAHYAPECLDTAIRHISKNEEGRFKGHYQVGLEILSEQDLHAGCLG